MEAEESGGSEAVPWKRVPGEGPRAGKARAGLLSCPCAHQRYINIKKN